MATNTYVALDKVTVTNPVASVTFNNINQGYTDLVLVLSGSLTTSGSSVWVRFNGDTATNYSSTILYGTGTAAGSTRETSVSNGCVFAGYQQGMSTSQSTAIMHIQNYANTTTYKTTLARYSDATQEAETAVGLWRKTPEAINSLTAVIVFGSRLFSIGTTFSLYGIAAAVPVAKATGGTITYGADGYTYHTFLSTGTFTPQTTLSCDVLTIAGGGGSGRGGGGAGGLVYSTSQTLTTNSYTATVGAGGSAGTFDSTNGTNGTNSNLTGGSLSLTAAAGGGGGSGKGTITANSGGSGGGGAGLYPSGGSAGGSATPSGQGNAGGSATGSGSTKYGSAGGGGFNAAGGAGTGSGGGAGGAGTSTYSSWGSATATGQNVSGTYYYCGGGGGGADSGTSGAGGNGGGGAGVSIGTANAGAANTGGGAGGNNNATGTSGGSGIVIVRYATF